MLILYAIALNTNEALLIDVKGGEWRRVSWDSIFKMIEEVAAEYEREGKRDQYCAIFETLDENVRRIRICDPMRPIWEYFTALESENRA